MNCTEANPFFAELVDHALTDDHEALRHVATCQHCATEFQQYQLLIARLGALPRPEPTRHLRQAIHARLDAQQERRPRVTWRFWLPATGLATAAVAGWVALTDFQSVEHRPTEMASIQEHPRHEEAAITGPWKESSEPVNISLQDFMEAYYDVSQPEPAARSFHLRPVWEALDANDPLRSALEGNPRGIEMEAVHHVTAH